MEAPTGSSRRIRTGLFEVDFGSSEVHREGRKVPLQEQPFRVLALLLERPGEVVTREELQARLWPAYTYVGFDEGLNTAIRKLRVAFGDSADNPRFIETLPRRGTVSSHPSKTRLRNPSVSRRMRPLRTPSNCRARELEAACDWSWRGQRLPCSAFCSASPTSRVRTPRTSPLRSE